MNVKTRKKIRKYGKARFAGDVRYREKVLMKIYEVASPEKKKRIMFEVDTYLQALKDNKVKPGESIIKAAFE